MTEEQTLDPQRQQKAKEYARIKRRFLLFDLLLGAALLLAWLLFGWSVDLRNRILFYTANPWLGVAFLGAIFGEVFTVIDLPLSYYTGFVFPHRYEMSNQTIQGWIGDQAKGLLLSVLLGGFLLKVVYAKVVYAVLRVAPETWWLWVGGIMLLFSVVLSNLAPVLISPLDENRADLAEEAGTHVRGVFKFDMSRRTKAANAALTGLGNTRRIILGQQFPLWLKMGVNRGFGI